MSWPFWSFRTSSPALPSPALPPDCESIKPLLPLYADRMASPDEVRRVEAHLPVCEGCRESLFWMQATHRALASRPVAIPPANLHLRIAEAIAASSAAPLLRPARSFTLRPAYAAAASLTVLGGVILSHVLLHPPVPSESVVTPAPPIIASVPQAASKVKHVLTHAAPTKPHQTLIARNVPGTTVKAMAPNHALAPKKIVLESTNASSGRVADSALIALPIHASVTVHVPVKSVVHPQRVPHEHLVANAKIPPVEKRHPSVADITAPQVASVPLLPHHDKEPLSVAVVVAPSTVTTQPAVRTASSATESGGFLAGVNAQARAMSAAAYGKNSFTVRQAYLGATNTLHALDHEHSGYQPAVWTPSQP